MKTNLTKQEYYIVNGLYYLSRSYYQKYDKYLDEISKFLECSDTEYLDYIMDSICCDDRSLEEALEKDGIIVEDGKQS